MNDSLHVVKVLECWTGGCIGVKLSLRWLKCHYAIWDLLQAPGHDWNCYVFWCVGLLWVFSYAIAVLYQWLCFSSSLSCDPPQWHAVLQLISVTWGSYSSIGVPLIVHLVFCRFLQCMSGHSPYRGCGTPLRLHLLNPFCMGFTFVRRDQSVRSSRLEHNSDTSLGH